MRARKVVTRSGKRFRGKYPSLKVKRTVHWESFIERDAIVHFEFHPLVISYQEQPSEEFYYNEKGIQCSCFPDFLLKFASGAELLVEIKPKKKLRSQKLRQKLDLIARRFAEQGRAYRVLTDEDIRRQPLFENLKRLRDAQRLRRSDDSVAESNSPFGPHSTQSLGELTLVLGDEDTVLSLVAAGTLRMNLEQPLTPASLVWAAGNTEAGNGAFQI